jgi:hypothetical protein
MSRQRVANLMLQDIPWDGIELAAPLTLPGALLAPSYVEQAQIAQPSSPPAGKMRLYPKSDGQYYVLDANGVETPIGSGTAGPPAASSFIYTQVMPQATWIVTHNLNGFPSVTVIDTGNTVIIPDVHYDSANAVTIKFGSATSGKAYLN